MCCCWSKRQWRIWKAASLTPHHRHKRLEDGLSSKLGHHVPIFPTKSSKRGDLYWGAGAEKFMDECGQVVTLDVDQISRPVITARHGGRCVEAIGLRS